MTIKSQRRASSKIVLVFTSLGKLSMCLASYAHHIWPCRPLIPIRWRSLSQPFETRSRSEAEQSSLLSGRKFLGDRYACAFYIDRHKS